ncbi:DnaB-like replicative helicase [Streptomyces phage Manuel]|uniref:DnaB-like dsDNA helicase n=1 Tax=Streptomyces phage Manuel TaxID=2053812 RepID=A0A2H4PR23_9CAUD|nr:DnaB-like replicative helicase [Streptomyces phage Manuel]ATW69354.1 DnaB-like dsDNA helicase [Streptomyces phage Manuel]
MKTLFRSVRRGLSAGEPLPAPWPIFDQKKITFRRSSMQMIAGPPGSMKTVMMLNIVDQMGSDVPTLYHSSDSDDFTMATRVLSMKTGLTTEEAEEVIMAGDHTNSDALRQFGHVKWSFHAAPTLEHMWREAEAFREVHGEYPHHTIIDILMDVDYEGAGEQNYWALMAELKVMARDQQTSLTIVHHTSEAAKGGTPPPRSAIMGKANQLPTTILTLWGDAHNETIDVAVVKNRFGPQDAMAKKFFRMKAQPALCRIEEDEMAVLFNDGVSVPDDQKVDLFGDESE